MICDYCIDTIKQAFQKNQEWPNLVFSNNDIG